jgi:uncharacterized protein (TIGR02145 family)
MKIKILLLSIILLCIIKLNAQNTMNIHQNNGTVLQIPLNTIDSITYSNNQSELAILSTVAVNNITSNSAISGGNIINAGNSAITQRGVCWNTSPNPTTANNATNDGSGTGSFSSNLTGLADNTTYYVRAYAINSTGTAYGNEIYFTTISGGSVNSWLNPSLTYGSLTDQEGNTYATIVIGTQEWMAENLRTTKYANGDIIPNITDNGEWADLTTGAWAHYHNNNLYEIPRGKLYNGHTIIDSRKICPVGWHVPTDEDWSIIVDNLGGEVEAGGKMKSTGTQFWEIPNSDATNESGFSGLPGGARYNGGYFAGLNREGYWWSSSNYDVERNWARLLYYALGTVERYAESKQNGFFIRCLKD